MLSYYYVSLRSEFRVVMSVTISALKDYIYIVAIHTHIL